MLLSCLHHHFLYCIMFALDFMILQHSCLVFMSTFLLFRHTCMILLVHGAVDCSHNLFPIFFFGGISVGKKLVYYGLSISVVTLSFLSIQYSTHSCLKKVPSLFLNSQKKLDIAPQERMKLRDRDNIIYVSLMLYTQT